MAPYGKPAYISPPMNEEVTIWRSSPSQLLNIGSYTMALILAAGIVVGGIFFPAAFAALLIPVLWMSWKYLVVKCQVYELTSQRLRLYEGVFNRKIDELELYRVKDTNIEQPFWFRIFGLGNVNLTTSDRSHEEVSILAVKDVTVVREHVRRHVESLRDQKRVREVDFEGGEDADFDSEFDLT